MHRAEPGRSQGFDVDLGDSCSNTWTANGFLIGYGRRPGPDGPLYARPLHGTHSAKLLEMAFDLPGASGPSYQM